MHATHCHEETNQLAVSQENVKQQQVNVVGETAFPRRNTRWAHIVGGGHRPISFMLFLLCFKFIDVHCINLESFVRSGEEDGLCTHSTASTYQSVPSTHHSGSTAMHALYHLQASAHVNYVLSKC